uniref:Uncharacterized protein n=1 Tax=Oryza brachyantha TaxID=4533 RepID=J3MC12_ORYBR
MAAAVDVMEENVATARERREEERLKDRNRRKHDQTTPTKISSKQQKLLNRTFQMLHLAMGSRPSPATSFQAWGLHHTLRRPAPPSHLCSTQSLSTGPRTPAISDKKSSEQKLINWEKITHPHTHTTTFLDHGQDRLAFLLAVAAKESCGGELLLLLQPWEEAALNLRAAAFLVPNLGLLASMEEGWSW